MIVRLTSQPPVVFVFFSLLMLVVGPPTSVLAASPDGVNASLDGVNTSLDGVNTGGERHCLESEQLCGWVERGVPDSESLGRKPVTVDAPMEVSVTMIASAVCTSAGVSVEQIVEPFAMVGPAIENSLDAVHQFQRWWNLATEAEHATQVETSNQIDLTFIDVNRILDTRVMVLAVRKPTDIQHFGPSVLVREFRGLPSDPVALMQTPPRRDILVGCSPMIFTIEETYMSYDMSDRDIKLWCVFPATTQPFCIRNRTANFDAAPMWDEFDQIVQEEPPSASDQIAAQIQCSAYCKLDDWVNRLEDWLGKDSKIRRAVRAPVIGQRIVGGAVRSQRMAGEAADAVAAIWPAVETDARPFRAGDALLARAGAIESDVPVAVEVADIASVEAAGAAVGLDRR